MADKRISEFLDGGLAQTGDELAAVRGGDNYKVRVGSAAAYDAGQSGGELLILEEDSSGTVMLPAVSGEQLTGLPVQTPTVAVSADDTASGYLEDKIKGSASITVTKNTDSAGEETLRLDVAGDLPFSNIAQLGANEFAANPTTGAGHIAGVALAASQLAGRGSSGNIAAITLGAGLSMSGTTLSANASSMVQIATATPTGVSVVDFNNIPQIYRKLYIVFNGLSHDNGSSRALRLAADDAATFSAPLAFINGKNISTSNSVATITSGSYFWTGETVAAAASVYGVVVIENYNATGFKKFTSDVLTSAPATISATGFLVGAPVQSLEFSWNGAGNFDAGTITLWGIP